MDVFHSNFALTLFQEVIDRCKSLVNDRYTTFVIDEVVQAVQLDKEEELKKLEDKLSSAEKLLDSFQPTTKNDWQHWQRWVEKVTGLSYDAEDLVDDNDSSNILSKLWPILSGRSVGRKIQEIQDKLEQIIRDLDLELRMVNRTSQQTQQRSPECRLVRSDEVLHPETLSGRENDKRAIINMLSGGKQKIIAIVGMDGLGKTSLAKYVLDDSRIRDNFKVLVWVPVNDRFKREMISTLEGKLQAEDETRNVLIVLDDLWEVNDNEWREFRHQFLNPSGCTVLLTTTYLQVANVTESDPYLLTTVKDIDCEEIISKARLSNHLSEFRCEILNRIAQVMAPKCKGLPVVADMLRCDLSSKLADESNDEWRTYTARDISELGVLERIFYPPRYLCLESHLKKCLAYCALFPREYDFKKDDLVQLWMAEDFLRCERPTSSVEQVGNEYFDELLSRSVFRRSDRQGQELPSYNMHEFMHRLAESMASYTCCQLRVENPPLDPSFPKTRHLSLLCELITPPLLEQIKRCDGLRTLLTLNAPATKIGRVPYYLFLALRRLRVLDLSCTDIQELPDSLGKLTNLRYLDASETRIERLPESASKLHRLQVLKLRNDNFRQLPKDMKHLTNLIYLDVNMGKLSKMPQSIGSLSYLKTLSCFKVGAEEGYRITELKNLEFLCGTVCLTNLEKVKDGEEAVEANLRNKASIKRLKLTWESCSIVESIDIDILACLQPHQYLEELDVINYGGSSFPAWLTSASHMLVSIHIKNCRNVRVLPALGQLPYLKTLCVEGLDLVEDVDYHFCGEGTARAFSSLEELSILDMEGLRRWHRFPKDSMSKLCKLKVEDCPNLYLIESLEHRSKLKRLEISCCRNLRALPELPASIENLIIQESVRLTSSLRGVGFQRGRIKNIPHIEIEDELVEDSDGCIDSSEDI